ncbi:hypothetical protein [uncultured Gammaproteobacteria bacterium]|jgi:hypothetical protein|uniref:Uncharacterized protein n=1 Tax=Bathymodiolus thermophilus thioautotrophic gill symbiont TaxID=2360 RepID=A0ABN7GA60_9GAMM|nr:hypothetical protein [Bathymodiolus thermophilus thioautotrophic gill symbiont]CAC9486829.1 hypothetical protein [uncultured Gammaproteobacteria bacterium]CAB5498730.1 hypothetical protein AZO1586I_380 [Bathymodiolus thermophilus thioautotrophic gill symbiont]CAC9496841.1 hypothetical protein [uncultured Gammaproteobacteria bacterium]CAC9536163.1 hypothetical protein [uncultured Gammaproteobacteria bacterium]CAC9989009.1 hypothetical protein [uncultured Gammaproteobacteria bacterium]
MLKNRINFLNDLINFDKPLQEISNNIRLLEWDSEIELVFMTEEQLTYVLDKYRKKHITKIELIDWANLIECREDIGFVNNLVQETISDIANIDISGVKI